LTAILDQTGLTFLSHFIAADITEDLQAALAQFAEIASDLKESTK
jgi:hypothetical protein